MTQSPLLIAPHAWRLRDGTMLAVGKDTVTQSNGAVAKFLLITSYYFAAASNWPTDQNLDWQGPYDQYAWMDAVAETYGYDFFFFHRMHPELLFSEKHPGDVIHDRRLAESD